MATVEGLKRIKREYPDAEVFNYLNSTAAIKAESDICYTSANAIDVVKSLDKQVLFVPDKNLESFASKKTKRKFRNIYK